MLNLLKNSNDPIIENIAVPNVTDNVLKSAYAGMVLRQVASHAFRRNCQDVIFLQRKLSLNIDRLVSKKHKIMEFPTNKSKLSKSLPQYSPYKSLKIGPKMAPKSPLKIDPKVMHFAEIVKT